MLTNIERAVLYSTIAALFIWCVYLQQRASRHERAIISALASGYDHESRLSKLEPPLDITDWPNTNMAREIAARNRYLRQVAKDELNKP